MGMDRWAGKRIGFIGAGRMAEALIRGVVSAGALRPEAIQAYDVDAGRLQTLAAELGIVPAAGNAEAARGADLVVLATKPRVAPAALEQARPGLAAGQTVVSLAAGVKIADLVALLPEGVGLVRVMPNTPCQVGAGMTVLAANSPATPEGMALAQALFDCCGETELLPESAFDAVTALSGSGPAYVFLLIEAMADGGVQAGLPREAAQRLAVQTALGAAALVARSGRHPAQLRDMVASPGGTTIAALAALEAGGVRAAVMQAVMAAARRSAELG